MTNPSPIPTDELKAFLRDNLRIEVAIESAYQGSMSDGPLYKDSHKLQLILCGETISEVYL